MPDRLEFSSATKKIIAQRASYRCVVPGCGKVTVGPGEAADDVVSIGTACHIYSAAAGGPRGQGGLTEEQIRAAENGAWACAGHGRLIDANDGQAYPAALLKGWRRLQEVQLRYDLDHRKTAAGWFFGFTIGESFLFRSGAQLEFGKCTVLQGGPHGKSMVAEWLGGLASRDALKRWLDARSLQRGRLDYFGPTETAVELTLTPDGAVRFVVDGSPAPEVPRDLAIVLMADDYWAHLRSDGGDHVGIAKALGVDPSVILGLADELRRSPTRFGQGLSMREEIEEVWDDEKGDDSVKPREAVKHLTIRRASGVSFGGMATSERTRTVIEFATALARHRARSVPTLLILDGSGWNLDPSTVTDLGRHLLDQPYQTLLTRYDGWQPDVDETWSDWSRFALSGKPPAADIKRLTWRPG